MSVSAVIVFIILVLVIAAFVLSGNGAHPVNAVQAVIPPKSVRFADTVSVREYSPDI